MQHSFLSLILLIKDAQCPSGFSFLKLVLLLSQNVALLSPFPSKCNAVEISDSAPTTQLVKEVTKRFSTPDAAPVSTEPAWLALAKRKAKAWSDCPQIIK